MAKEIVHENAHARDDELDPKVNGPFLDDVRADQERAYRDSRNVRATSEEDFHVDNPT
jgi:hypothetical protein